MEFNVQRKTIGASPFDVMIPKQEVSIHEVVRPSKRQKERLTVHLPIDLIERIKNCVFWTPGQTLAGFAENVLTDAIDKVESERGEPFPHRNQELKGGRPIR
jgi:hypothetical protein